MATTRASTDSTERDAILRGRSIVAVLEPRCGVQACDRELRPAGNAQVDRLRLQCSDYTTTTGAAEHAQRDASRLPTVCTRPP